MNKAKLLLPFPILAVFTYLYSFLDSAVFVKVFGCGCPIEAPDENGMPILTRRIFNANDLRVVAYTLFTAAMVLLSVKLSKTMADKKLRILYCIAVWLFTGGVSLFICKTKVWR